MLEFITNAGKLPVPETAACPMPAFGIIRFWQVGTFCGPWPLACYSGGRLTAARVVSANRPFEKLLPIDNPPYRAAHVNSRRAVTLSDWPRDGYCISGSFVETIQQCSS